MSGDEDSYNDYAVYYTPFPVHATKADVYIRTGGAYIAINVTLVGSPSISLYGGSTTRPGTINLPNISVDTMATGLQVLVYSNQTPGRAAIDTGSYVKVYADD